MTAPKKYPYNRRPRKSDPKRQRKRSATENPYLFIPDKPATPEPKPKNLVRSVANRKPIPPARNLVKDQRQIREKPVDFASNLLGVKPWGKQKQILKALADNDQVAVRSCNGAGKTFTAALAIIWWLMSYDDAVVITTAPSERQVREILWRELRRLYMPLRGHHRRETNPDSTRIFPNPIRLRILNQHRRPIPRIPFRQHPRHRR